MAGKVIVAVRSPCDQRRWRPRSRCLLGRWSRFKGLGLPCPALASTPVACQACPSRWRTSASSVKDIEATIAFFTDLGLTVVGRDVVSGDWTDTPVGLDGNHAKIAMLQTPDGNGRIELFDYIHPDAIETEPTRPNDLGMHRVASPSTTSTTPSR